uniref:Uncharacterized protein n=1 Tax=Candidatus Methanogaster sp. ANME-2c ERB4 TaxID=2759911 RepID=A0A7G9Y2L0_9EURY|nr:hypothetical protein MKPHGJHB_00022 [Methanosarcinales archaeon ANME-2c ERB4]
MGEVNFGAFAPWCPPGSYLEMLFGSTSDSDIQVYKNQISKHAKNNLHQTHRKDRKKA